MPGMRAEAELREAVLMSMRARQLEEEARARSEAETRVDVEQAVLTVEAAPALYRRRRHGASACLSAPASQHPGTGLRDRPATGCRLALRALR